MINPDHFTAISELGEFALIDRLTSDFDTRLKSSVIGIGDDAAEMNFNGDNSLISTEMFVHGVHFDLTYFPMKHLGYKCITASLSDIYAMNGKASQALVSLAVSDKFSVEMLEDLYAGIRQASSEYGIDLIGGDTTTIHRGLIISVTVIGHCEPDTAIYRGGAQENDLICVSGDLGAAYLGLQLLEREKKVYLDNPDIQPELNEEYEYLYQRFLKPDARRDILDLLAELAVKPTSMIDVSYGLSSELFHLAKHSDLGATIYENKLPIHPSTVSAAEAFSLDPTTCALNGGEDYELLFTIPPADFQKLAARSEISIIGHITDKSQGVRLISSNGNSYPLMAQGWQAFS